ncbi:unnamed protein product [Clonostachys rosea f. rosea IK726]|uniref:Uncharacterized protein n=2 Tax=Bionectria ochroleuca TaxID=29856 RepID=A0A0B7KCG8_BIOOC|nr:unnamed protein product [Clonostachys rosea f. rosea IK726]
MPASAVFAPGATALITGAAAGIGLAIAKLCQSKGMSLFLVDINADDLEAAKKALSTETNTVVTAVTDVSDTSQWQSLKATAADRFGSIELLVLNAGKGMKGGWGEEDYFRQTLETNLFGVIHGINTFLPVVKKASESKPTSIVITGSKQGITNPPGNPAYNASKAAVKSLAEQLSYDLRESSTSVHLLVPGWTFTNLAGALHFKEKPAGAWLPEQVAEYLYRKMEQDKFYVICPDNDVTEETDKKRMLWSTGDIVYERPPLSRWREDWKEEATDTMAKTQI